MLMAKALEIEKNTTEKYNHAMKEEKEIVDDIVRSETFNFLLRESIHSFSLFKDYFTENENIWYDSHIKIEKFNNISIERIDPEEEKLQGKIKQFCVDTILHDNMFKYFMTSIKFIKQRLLYLFDYVWKEKSLWSNTRENKLKIVMILLNKSYEIFEGIMESIQLKIENQNGSSFDISLFQCGEERQLIKEISNVNLSTENVKYGSSVHNSVRKLIGAELESFFSQTDCRVLECEVKVTLDSIFDTKRGNESETQVDGTISFSIFLVKPNIDTITCLGRKLEIINQTFEKKKNKASILELSKEEEFEVKDFKIMFDVLNNESPLSFNFVDYRYLVEDVEGPMTEEDKDLVCRYLKVQEEFSKIKVSNTRSFLEKIVQF